MAEEAKITFTGEDKGLFRLYDEERKKVEQGIEALERRKRKSKEADTQEREGRRKANEEQRKAAEVIRSVETAQERYERQIRELRRQLKSGAIDQQTFNRAVAKSKTELGAGAASAGLLTTKFIGLIGTTFSLAAAFGKAATEQASLRDETEKTVLKLDELTRKFQIQAGLTNLQARDARQNILEIARANAVSPDTAFTASTQLVSSGFARPDTSGALDAFLKIQASSNEAGQDPQALIQGAGQFLAAFGLSKSGENLLDVGVRTRGLFAETDVKVGDLTNLAQAGGTFAGAGVSLEDTLSAFAILREQMGAAEAATQGRNIVTSFQTFAADAGRSRVLREQLGLDPSQLDLVGETLPQALGTLNTAIQNLPEEQRAAVQTQLFGRENLRGSQALLGSGDKFERFRALQRDRGGFVAGVNVAQSGPNAAANRFEVDRALLDLQAEDEANRRFLDERQLANEDAATFQRGGRVSDVAFGVTAAARDALLFTNLADPGTFVTPEGKASIESAQQSNFGLGDLQDALGDNSAALRENTEATRSSAGPSQPPAAALSN